MDCRTNWQRLAASRLACSTLDRLSAATYADDVVCAQSSLLIQAELAEASRSA